MGGCSSTRVPRPVAIRKCSAGRARRDRGEGSPTGVGCRSCRALWRHGGKFTGGRDHGGVRRAGGVGGPRRRACRAALGIQEETKRLAVDVAERDGVDLQLRVGLNSGEVIAGEIGSGPFVTPPWVSKSVRPDERESSDSGPRFCSRNGLAGGDGNGNGAPMRILQPGGHHQYQ